MSSFIQHTAQGGFITALPFKLFYPQFTVTAFIFGAVSGLLPDLIEFVGRIFFGVYLKPLTHTGALNKIMFWNPAWQIHTIQDRYWHSLNENDWKREMNEWVGWFIIIPLIIKYIFL